jgi:ferric-dicitrate binding protein FerR (iron transport regulator)
LLQLLRELVESRGEMNLPLGQLLLANAQKPLSLRQFGAQLAIIADPSERQASAPLTRKRREPNPRRRALAGAAFAAAVGIAVSFGLWQHANRADATAAPLPKHLVLDQKSDSADER